MRIFKSFFDGIDEAQGNPPSPTPTRHTPPLGHRARRGEGRSPRLRRRFKTSPLLNTDKKPKTAPSLVILCTLTTIKRVEVRRLGDDDNRFSLSRWGCVRCMRFFYRRANEVIRTVALYI
jgi:hypothetical protein